MPALTTEVKPAAGQVLGAPPAKAEIRPAAANANASEAASPGTDPVLNTVWLRQSALLLAFCAALVTFSAARWAERSWLMAVFSACVAMVSTATVGTVLGGMLLEQAATGEEKNSTPQAIRQVALTK